MLVTASGMIIEVKLDAPLNALPLMSVTVSGMVIEIKLVAVLNASNPMLVTSVPISTLDRSLILTEIFVKFADVSVPLILMVSRVPDGSLTR